ncbi:class I SAM-dependent methyltransferase [Robertmurraya massiliosenegalensis]|uniref:class I SAM-dependent methyltransferase n=1 Tax=Robertmurraya massiliosenegalensis TaxID=1287657 RepID=UPI0002FFAD3D|nr:class I SAM-dependent methyltransferase [Robertmurraya massiliosenegalensis]
MNTNEKIKRRYNRISSIYEVMDKMIKAEWRLNLLSNISGNVLEVGVGTGANFPFYPTYTKSLTGVDFSKGMLKQAQEKLVKGRYPFPIRLMEADIQELPFPDDMFDTVVSTCVFCSVPDPLLGLKELKRVCKPNGQILLLEHVRSDQMWVGIVMDLLNPLTVRLWGANINRETINTIERSGLKVETNKNLMGSIFRELSVSPNK